MAKVTGKLQITVPKRFADRLAIRPGDDLDWRVDGDSLRITPRKSARESALEDRLTLFDESTRRQQDRNRAWKARRQARRSSGRGWTREELYQRGRAR